MITQRILPIALVACTAMAFAQEPAPAPEQAPGDILELDIDQLGRVDVVVPSLDIEVTSVSRSESTIGKSPAAIFVITNEMIRRSGAREVPEVLRMAPGVNVARMTGNKWAVSIRGFNQRFSNKLLVQIDGRTVYTPLFAGVYWDVQNVVLEDVDRIEIIRGPGATVWGENAVNGIINIITKDTRDTQGGYFETGTGDYWESFSSARVGGEVADGLTYRMYGQWFERDTQPLAPNFNAPFNGPPSDQWRMGHGGLRFDWRPDFCNHFMFTSDYYDGVSGSRSSVPGLVAPGTFITSQQSSEVVRGGHMLGRWAHTIDDDRDWAIQFFYDRTERRASTVLAPTVGNDRDTIDLDFQRRFPIGQNHEIICGAGYRFTEDFIRSTVPAAINPNKLALDVFSYFIQDQITLVDDRLWFIAGSKFSHNDFTGFEMQPSVRMLWTPDERRAVWASVSRAVRTPSRADRGLVLTIDPLIPVQLVGNPNFESEEVLSYEIGYRAQPNDSFFWDLALFYNDYTDLSNVGGAFPVLTLVNTPTHSQTWGFELATTYQVNDCWQLRGAYSFLRGSIDLGSNIFNSPRNQLYLQSSMDLGCHFYFDLIGRYVDQLPSTPPAFPTPGPTSVDSYFEMDARIAYRPTDTFEWYVTGRNLMSPSHNEFIADPTGLHNSEVPREVYSGVTLRY